MFKCTQGCYWPIFHCTGGMGRIVVLTVAPKSSIRYCFLTCVRGSHDLLSFLIVSVCTYFGHYIEFSLFIKPTHRLKEGIRIMWLVLYQSAYMLPSFHNLTMRVCFFSCAAGFTCCSWSRNIVSFLSHFCLWTRQQLLKVGMLVLRGPLDRGQ